MDHARLREDVGIPPVPVALIPVLVFPGENGASDEAMIDSTSEIIRLEAAFKERSLIPPDRALAFLHSLIEDYGDEWLTKPMFHYRWNYERRHQKGSYVLILDRMPHLDGERLERAAKMIADRQIARLTVVGSNPYHARRSSRTAIGGCSRFSIGMSRAVRCS